MVEGRVVDSNLDDFSSFSGNLFAVLVNYFEMEDIASGMVDGNAVFVNCTSEIIIVFFYSIFPNICWILLCKKGGNFLLSMTICIFRLCFV